MRHIFTKVSLFEMLFTISQLFSVTFVLDFLNSLFSSVFLPLDDWPCQCFCFYVNMSVWFIRQHTCNCNWDSWGKSSIRLTAIFHLNLICRFPSCSASIMLLLSCFTGMDFHEDLSRLGEKEGLKGRKLNKAVESFTWNITVLKVKEGRT